jgi:predicted AAA+ superfamily ATPase
MEKEIQRSVVSVGNDYLNHFPVVFIEGARQVGKSTLSRQLRGDDAGAVFVNFDDPAELRIAQENPSFFVEQAETTLVIDEIQRFPDVLLYIKASLEKDRRPGRFLATGSVGVLKTPGNQESLAGRAVTIHLQGLSQNEKNGTSVDFVKMLGQLDNPYRISSSLTRDDYANIIVTGGFPEVHSQPATIRRAWFRSYIDRIIERDLGIFPRGTQPARARSVLSLLAANHGGEIVYSRFANDLDVSMPSVRDTVDALAAVFLVEEIPAWSTNLTKREISRKKAVISDSGLAAHLMSETAESLSQIRSTTFGPLLEGLVASELLKQKYWANEYFDLYHYRDTRGTEVDFVLALENGDIIGVEVKATADPRISHAPGLRKLKDRVGSKWRAGVVFHTGTKGAPLGDDIFALPVSALWGETTHRSGVA